MKKQWYCLMLSASLVLSGLLPKAAITAHAAESDTAAQVFDGTQWTVTEEGKALELQLDGQTRINRIRINESSSGAEKGSVQKFHIEIKDGDAWKEVYDNDYILTNRSCILPQDVTTDAVRLVIDAMDPGTVTIDKFEADYQSSTGDSDFMNVGYVSNQWYDIGNAVNRPIPQQLDSLTDIIMIGSFTFDKDGKFLVIDQDPGPKTVGSYAPDSEEASALMETWLQKMSYFSKNVAAGKTNIWISFQGFKASGKGAASNDDGTFSSVFMDETVAQAFAESVAKFALEHGVCGVDIDWEYPNEAASHGGNNEDCMKAFRTLLHQLSEVLHKNGLKLSCTLAPGYKDNLTSEEYKAIDYLSWMLYTNTKNAEYGTNVNAQIPYAKMADLVDFAIEKGCDPSKIWVGMPLFGNNQGNGGAQQYFNLYVTYLAENGATTVPKGLNTISFNGKDSYYNGIYLLQDKVAYAAEKGCAGIMTWWVAQDIHVFDDGETMDYTVNGATAVMRGEDSLSRAVYEAVKRFTGVDPIPAKEPYTEAALRAEAGLLPNMKGNNNPVDRKVFEDKAAQILAGINELAGKNVSVPEDITSELSSKLGQAFGTTTGMWRKDAAGSWFAYVKGGYPAGQWESISGKWYYFNPDGYRLTGWQTINGTWYHLDANGAMDTGWYLDPADGKWYYLGEDGAMVTGWTQVDGKWYYLNEAAASSYVYDAASGSWVYADTGARPYGSMYADETTPDHCQVDASGAWIEP